MQNQLKGILETAKEKIASAPSTEILEGLRVEYLGKKGALTAILRQMGSLSAEERPIVGALANTVRGEIEEAIKAKAADLKNSELLQKLQKEKIDITLPAKEIALGTLHPLAQVERELSEIFIAMGFSIAEGPEIEKTYYNFDALNAPADHPSREPSDTFYIGEDILLRTQTSPVQIRTMEHKKPPIRVISPGRVYRCDAVDGTHSPMFHQLEGLVVDKNVTMGDLKGTLDIKQARDSGEGYIPFLEEMGRDIVTVHVSDVDSNGRLCLPGRGTFDFKELFKRLDGVGFSGAVLIEVYKENYNELEELFNSLQYLKDLAEGI
jgi:phenylalanyl-tRNA synthetase alpha chain